MPAPTAAAAYAYLGPDTSWAEADATSAFASERASQATRCRVPAHYAVTITTTAASSTVTAGVGSFTAADVGREVEAVGVPEGALVVSVAVDGASAVLSGPATGTATVAADVHDVWPGDLVEALYRRVAHTLALRALPLGFQATVSEGGVATNSVGGTDAEVRRLEAPYRRLVVG